MHFLTIVVVPPGHTGDPVDYTEKALVPFYEEGGTQLWVPEPEFPEGGFWTNPVSFWDWYQIGGRWAGLLQDGYDPQHDPRNWERCDTCNGTGTRERWLPDTTPEWIAHCKGCNGCGQYRDITGTPGVRVKWSTNWVNDIGNVARLGDVRDILEDRPPRYLVHEGVTDGEFFVDDAGDWFMDPGRKTRDAIAKLSDDCTVVVVDAHC